MIINDRKSTFEVLARFFDRLCITDELQWESETTLNLLLSISRAVLRYAAMIYTY